MIGVGCGIDMYGRGEGEKGGVGRYINGEGKEEDKGEDGEVSGFAGG